jgi:hypothetical protein
MVTAMADQPKLVIQVPRDGEVDRQLRADVPPSVADGDVVVTPGPTDAEGRLDAPHAGEVVMSVPSPEALAHEPDEVRRVIARAGTGTAPLVVEVEAAEELRDEELVAVLEAADHAKRAVILRIMGDA